MSDKKKTNKTEKIIEHLENYGTITNIEAITLYGATRLSAIIFNLRKRGYAIETITIPFEDKYGNRSVYGKYVLHEVN